MAWPQRTIESWSHLTEIAAEVSRIGNGQHTYLCRGESDADWGLAPSFVRHLPRGVSYVQALEIERRAMEGFMAQAHLHLPHSWLPQQTPAPALADWWALLQHYSAPTRLIDWTYSLFASAYFAINKDWDKDGAVLLVQCQLLMEAMAARFGKQDFFSNADFTSESPPRRLIHWTPSRQMDRIVAQQGTFTVSLDVMADHGELIEDALGPMTAGSEIIFAKLIIPAELKPEFLLQLRSMNIAAHTLFPGADGLGNSVADIIRVARPR